VALELADQNVSAVRRIVRVLEQSPQPDSAAIGQARGRLAELIKAHAAAPHAPADALADAARLAMSERDYVAAISCYRRALSAGGVDSELRLGLATALASAGRLDEAIEEASLARRFGAKNVDSFILNLRLRAKPASAPTTAPSSVEQ
jgi:tetratricopeptide (TPR) repeat protein